MRLTLTLLPICLGMLAVAGVRSRADVTFASRTSSYNITFADSNAFKDASASYDSNIVTHADKAGDTVARFFNVKSGYQNYAHSSAGDINISGETFTAGIGRYDYKLTAPTPLADNGSGSDFIHYDTAISSSFNTSWIVSGMSNGYHTLRFLGGGSAVNTHYPEFDVRVTLQGNWSHLGTSAGTLHFDGIDPSWTIVDDFVFNSITQQTTFSAVNPNFGSNGGPNLAFTLYGAQAVPEVGSLLSLAGMLALAGPALLHCRSRTRRA